MKKGRIWLDRPRSWGFAPIIAIFHIWSLDISRGQATLILSLVTQRQMSPSIHSLNLGRNNACEHQLFSEFGWKCHPEGSRASEGETAARRAKSRTSLTFLGRPSHQLGGVGLKVLCRAFRGYSMLILSRSPYDYRESRQTFKLVSEMDQVLSH